MFSSHSSFEIFSKVPFKHYCFYASEFLKEMRTRVQMLSKYWQMVAIILFIIDHNNNDKWCLFFPIRMLIELLSWAEQISFHLLHGRSVAQSFQLWEAIDPLESCVCRVVPSEVVIWKRKSGVSMGPGRGGSVRKQGKHSRQRELQIQRLQGRKKDQWTWNVSSGEWHEMRFRSRQRAFMLGLLYC